MMTVVRLSLRLQGLEASASNTSALNLASSGKKKRHRTLKAKMERNVMNHPLLPACPSKCVKKCAEEISDEERLTINSCFWKLSFSERRQWLATYILEADVKRRKSEFIETDGEHVQTSRRSFSRTYSLPLQTGTTATVCKTMFLSTLGMKYDGMVTELSRAKRRI